MDAFFFLPVALVLWLVVVALVLFGVYWTIRLAIRHEREHERRRGPGHPGPPPH